MLPRVRVIAVGVACGVVILSGCQPDGQPGAGGPSVNATAAPTLPAPTAPSHAPASVRRTASARVGSVRYLDGQPLPDPRLTPGAAFGGVGPSSFCVSGYTSRVRSVSESLRRQVFADYHVPFAQRASYEVDHLIPLELGGDNSDKNLWPERGSIPNPKDGLENELHNLVCTGELSTSAAQHAIASNWVAALHTYGSSSHVYESSRSTNTPRPEPTHASNATGATAKCKDGTDSYAAHHQGACSHHGGVSVWYR